MYKKRIEKLRKNLKEKNLEAVLIADISNLIYLTGFSGFVKEEREAYLLITKDKQFILTDGRYSEAVRNEIPHFELIERSGQDALKNFFKKIKAKKVGVEEDVLTVSEHKALKKHFKNLRHFNLRKHRSIKTPGEIEKIEKAAKIGDQAFNYILKTLKPGISEKQLAGELEAFIKREGGVLACPINVSFGKNSSIPHHQPDNTILKALEGEFILFDYGVKLYNYCSDMTRTVFLGKATDKQQKIYQTVLSAQKKAVDYINSILKKEKKLKAAKADKVARDYINSLGFPSIPHSLGHGVGLEVHEEPSLSPRSKEELKEGMVFSIEPGIYIPGFGGVRIEDLYAIQNGKLKQLSHSPKKIISV